MFAISIQYMPKALFNLCALSVSGDEFFFVFLFSGGVTVVVVDVRFRNAHAITLIAFDWSIGRFLFCRTAKIETDACTERMNEGM